VISQNSPIVKLNCKHYVGQEEKLEKDLFGSDELNLIEQSKNGVLFIDAIHLMSASAKMKLVDLVERRAYSPLNTTESKSISSILVCACDQDINQMILESLTQKFPIKIELPELQLRSMDERFQLIQQFFTIEAAKIQRSLTINSEVLRNLLLYECNFNVKQLRNDIQLGCANAYVREIGQSSTNLNIYIGDFNHYVRKGFLFYKAHREEVERIIPENYNYSFSEENIEKTEIIESELKKQSIYDAINSKVSELKDRGIPQKDINLIVSLEMENTFKQYQNQLSKQIVNKEQLSKLVDPKLITLVEDFLNEAVLKFNRTYPIAVFYGLSLHLNAGISRQNAKQTLSNDQIMDVVEKYKDEYSFSLNFASKLEKVFDVRFPIDEVVLITLFLVDNETQSVISPKPVVLVAMHGNTSAHSVAETVNALVKGDNTFSYDLSLDKTSQEAYEELKSTLINIDQGKGVIVIYDMGSIKTMCETISEESGINIRLIHMPLTLVVLDAARKATMEESLDSLVDGILDSMKENLYLPVRREVEKTPVIVTLCSTGEGGAIQIKDYLIRHLSLKDTEVIPLAISDRARLATEIDAIQKRHFIKTLIGTYKPKGLDLPFISISKVFETDPQLLKTLIENVRVNDRIYYTQAIYDYLDEQLEFVDVEKVRKLLPNIMNEINIAVNGELTQDQKLGLFIHIACSINRLLAYEKQPINLQKESIMKKYGELSKIVLQQFRSLEKAFGIIFSDDEIANVITIIKKL
jgi:transcriptional regulatory protein LevR